MQKPTGDGSLVPLVLADLGVAATSGALAAPFVAAIDTAITMNASGKGELWPSLQKELRTLTLRPLKYATGAPFRWLWAVFFSTYAAANTADTLSRAAGRSPEKYVLSASTAANMTSAMAKVSSIAGVQRAHLPSPCARRATTHHCPPPFHLCAQDRAFAQLYGVIAPRPAPWSMYGAFFVRDILSMAFFFTLPPVFSSHLQRQAGVGEGTADVAAQLASPLVVQYLSCPFHMLGLDLYNTESATLAQRWQTVRQQLPVTVIARQLRVIPPFCIGGNLNRSLRARAHLALGLKPPTARTARTSS
jgi:hypothetical protein